MILLSGSLLFNQYRIHFRYDTDTEFALFFSLVVGNAFLYLIILQFGRRKIQVAKFRHGLWIVNKTSYTYFVIVKKRENTTKVDLTMLRKVFT